ncbi:MAG: FKBP-type peptidyl-prolyl cis-trans isomerase [Candidatus Micrarchaeia archaeon]|jgi:FKBP-type peptidyl-prolyl cis-trans isomerase 2
MAFKDGDFVEIEYTAWRVADNSIVFTTDKKKAEENGIYNKDARYGPQLVVIGKGSVISGLEKAIRGMAVNETKKIELGPEEAFGERNPDLVRVMSLSDFRSRDINPYPGMQLEIDGYVATVKSVNSGRVLVDLNHPLAGEKLVYEVKVDRLIQGDKEKVEALAKSNGLTPKEVSLEGNTAKIVIGSEVKKDASYFFNKESLVNEIFKYLESVNKVLIEEEHTRESSQKESESAPTVMA